MTHLNKRHLIILDHHKRSQTGLEVNYTHHRCKMNEDAHTIIKESGMKKKKKKKKKRRGNAKTHCLLRYLRILSQGVCVCVGCVTAAWTLWLGTERLLFELLCHMPQRLQTTLPGLEVGPTISIS